MTSELEELMKRAREASWKKFGKQITFYHPGMFRYNGEWGKYPAISITGNHCALQCDHCRGRLLETMLHVTTPAQLIETCRDLEKDGNTGCLITGGSDKFGALPWEEFLPAIKIIKETTNLHISVHGGMVHPDIARGMARAGIDQVLLDVVGDAGTLGRVFHVDFGPEKITETLDALVAAGVDIVPHIVVGLDHGEVRGEYNAIRIIKNYNPDALVIVSLMPLSGTPMKDVSPPEPEEVAKVMATARLEMPSTPISLGCARDRSRPEMDVLAVDCGVNRIAIPSEEAIMRAKQYGLDMEWQTTCCSLANISKEARNER